MANSGYSEELDESLRKFERKLEDRWLQTIYDAVRYMDDWRTPGPLVFSNYYGSPQYWDHRRPEVQAHLTYGCEYMRWYENGHHGDVQSVRCPGTIRDADKPVPHEVWWEDHTEIVDEDSIDCGIGELFAAAEGWASGDRGMLAERFPMWDNVDSELATLKAARDTLAQMAADLGANLQDADSGDFQDKLNVSDLVDEIFLGRDDNKAWRVYWTGTASDAYAEGILASTKPTLLNHQRLAHSLSQLINRRATVVKTYRENNLKLVEGATAALGERSEETTDHTKKWQYLQGLGTAVAIPPAAAPVGTAMILTGWLGERLLATSKHVGFKHHPGKVTQQLWDEQTAMSDKLADDESDYDRDVAKLRESVNGVPSTFLELYDLTENNPTGSRTA